MYLLLISELVLGFLAGSFLSERYCLFLGFVLSILFGFIVFADVYLHAFWGINAAWLGFHLRSYVFVR